jgi:hypothetical protein
MAIEAFEIRGTAHSAELFHVLTFSIFTDRQ